jgi:hypothetical protein
MRRLGEGMSRQAFSYLFNQNVNWYHLSGEKSNHRERLILTEENQSNFLLPKLE